MRLKFTKVRGSSNDQERRGVAMFFHAFFFRVHSPVCAILLQKNRVLWKMFLKVNNLNFPPCSKDLDWTPVVNLIAFCLCDSKQWHLLYTPKYCVIQCIVLDVVSSKKSVIIQKGALHVAETRMTDNVKNKWTKSITVIFISV